MAQSKQSIALFEGQQVRKVRHNDEWWFSVTDVITVLTDSTNSTDYLKKMRLRDAELAKGWGQIVTPLTVQTTGGKQKVNCALSGLYTGFPRQFSTVLRDSSLDTADCEHQIYPAI